MKPMHSDRHAANAANAARIDKAFAAMQGHPEAQDQPQAGDDESQESELLNQLEQSLRQADSILQQLKSKQPGEQPQSSQPEPVPVV